MLSTEQIASLLQRVTYKPGWRFEVYDGRHEGQHFVITTEVPDAYDPSKTTTLDVHSMLPPCRDQQAFMDWLGWRLARCEVHESREFLRLDEVPWSDPHGPDADQDRG